jgi:hypothetical protein
MPITTPAFRKTAAMAHGDMRLKSQQGSRLTRPPVAFNSDAFKNPTLSRLKERTSSHGAVVAAPIPKTPNQQQKKQSNARNKRNNILRAATVAELGSAEAVR